MTWTTTGDVEDFLGTTGTFLRSDPVRHQALLTETDFWRRLPAPGGGRFGTWVEDGEVRAATVHLPDHPVLCSPLTTAAIAELPRTLPFGARLAVEESDAAAVVDRWRAIDRLLRPRATVSVLRLGRLRSSAPLPPGHARIAGTADLDLLRGWFALFQERFPADPSAVEFVVDHPVAIGAVVVWEVDGRPVAMSSRTPPVAGMTRIGLAFQPTEGTAYADAALAAGCRAAVGEVEHVLVMSGTPASTRRYEDLGFEVVGHRVVLEPAHPG